MSEFPKIAKSRLAASQSRGADTPHPEADLLNAFAEQRLPTKERESVLAHLAVCGDCRDIVSLASAAAPVPAPAQTQARTQLMRWTWMRWAIPAASMAIILVAVSLKWMETGGNLGPRSEDTFVSGEKAPAKFPASEAPKRQAEENPSAAQAPTPSIAPKGPAEKAEGRYQPQVTNTGNAIADLRRDERQAAWTRGKETDQVTTAPASEPAFVAGGALNARQPAAPTTPAVAAPAAANPAAMAEAKKDALAASNAPPPVVAKSNAVAASSVEVASETVAKQTSAKPTAQALARKQKTEPQSAYGYLTADGKAVGEGSGSIDSANKPASARIVLDSGEVLAGHGASLWRGRTASTLMHSTDGGNIWKSVALSADGHAAVGDIASINVEGPQVTVRLKDGAVWSSPDDGKTWKVQPAPAKK